MIRRIMTLAAVAFGTALATGVLAQRASEVHDSPQDDQLAPCIVQTRYGPENARDVPLLPDGAIYVTSRLDILTQPSVICADIGRIRVTTT